jgi:two-component system response regulator PilR (NtrC family)
MTMGPPTSVARRHDAPATVAAARARVLVADDELSMRELLSIVLRREGYEVLLAANGDEALSALRGGPVDMIVSDVRMPDITGVDVLRVAKQADPDVEALMVTAFASYDTAVEAMRLGACDYLTKPFDVEELKQKVRQGLDRRRMRREHREIRGRIATAGEFGALIGRSEGMLQVFKLIGQVAATDSTVLITGESGTGKELAARTIHLNSARRERPFVAVNCGALTETLLESELFGYVRGAFTGADVAKKGLIEAADKGTVFLDEIAEMTPAMQVKLLRVLQERRFRRVGGTEEIEADIRVIAATNRDLSKAITEGKFREDLFYRLNVIPVRLLALRERREDIPLLAEHFVAQFAGRMGKPVTGVSPGAVERLVGYLWPGNIRELENAIERAVALEQTSSIQPGSLPEALSEAPAAVPGVSQTPTAIPASGFDLERHVQDIEREYIAEALRRAGGVKTKAAELLGMSFRSFRYYLKKYSLK